MSSFNNSPMHTGPQPVRVPAPHRAHRPSLPNALDVSYLSLPEVRERLARNERVLQTSLFSSSPTSSAAQGRSDPLSGSNGLAVPRRTSAPPHSVVPPPGNDPVRDRLLAVRQALLARQAELLAEGMSNVSLQTGGEPPSPISSRSGKQRAMEAIRQGEANLPSHSIALPIDTSLALGERDFDNHTASKFSNLSLTLGSTRSSSPRPRGRLSYNTHPHRWQDSDHARIDDEMGRAAAAAYYAGRYAEDDEDEDDDDLFDSEDPYTAAEAYDPQTEDQTYSASQQVSKPPPTPFHILRAHHSPISSLYFTAGNNQVFAGDQDGFVSITDLSSRRVIAYWKAHEGGILSVREWNGGLVSQGRDNAIHFYEELNTSALTIGPTPASVGPEVRGELVTNSLNFCPLSLTLLDGGIGSDNEQGLLAIPNLTDSELIDIYHLPSMRRLHSKVNFVPKSGGHNAETSRSGLVMSIHIKVIESSSAPRLVLACGYEDGRVEVWACSLEALERSMGTPWSGETGSERVWDRLWQGRAHREAIMAMAVNPAFTKAFTVSADDLLCRVDLSAIMAGNADNETLKTYSMGQLGHSSVQASPDGRVVAVGGWDGKIRLFSTATFKPLGTLSYHRESVQALAFAHSQDLSRPSRIMTDAEDSDDEGHAGPRERWFASGGKDRRIGLWSLMDFKQGR